MTPFEWISAVGSVATAVAVAIAVWQLAEGRKQARTQFEDSLSREYRDLAQRIPVKALLGEPLDESEYAKAHDELYRYIDLSNEQVFLRQNNRVSVETWKNWASGMRANLALPAFDKAWLEVKERAPGSFQELRWLEETGFKGDPRTL